MKVDISAILPQRPPFVMIDEFLSYSPETVQTALTVCESNIFFEDGCLSAEGLMENFAQTCAARIGYINKYILHKDVNIGYIGAVKNWALNRLPREGERIVTQIDVIQEIGPMVKVKAEARVGEDVLACGEMTIALSDIAVEPGAEAATSATASRDPAQKTASQPLPQAAPGQLIEVRGNRLALYEIAADGSRRKVLRSPCGHGRNGFGLPPAGLPSSAGQLEASADVALPVKREGDGRTPIGTYPLELAFGVAGNPGTALPWRDITPYSYWSEEQDSYNTWVECLSESKVFQVSQSLDHLEQKRPISSPAVQEMDHLEQQKAAGEHLADYPLQYKYAAAIGYNTAAPVFGAGSAIFLHCFGPRKGISRLLHLPAWLRGFFRCSDIATAGCISVPEAVMLRLLRSLRPGAKIKIMN